MIRMRFKTQMAADFNDISLNDCYVFSYYLYVICDSISGNEEETVSFTRACDSQIALFFRLLDKLNHRAALREFLENAIKDFEEKGSLNRCPNDDFEDEADKRKRRILHFSSSNIAYVYDEDTEIDRAMSRHNIKPDPDVINLHRFFYVHNDFMLTPFVENFLLRKVPKETLTPLAKIPSYISKALNDTSVLRFMTESLELTDDEEKYLLFSYRCNSIADMYAIIKDLTFELLNIVRTRITGINKREYQKLIKKTGSLRSFGFIDDEGLIDGDLTECIINQDLNIFFGDLIKEVNCDKAYPLESFTVNKNATKIMQKMIEGNENISLLLYGNPGSGKTEFAKALAKASGMKPLVFKNEVEIQKSAKGNDNVLCRLNLLLSIARNDSILIIDEADTLLKTKTLDFFGMTCPSSNKGTVNKMLENSKNKIIWIVNFISQMDISTLRRFNFSYKFDAMTKEQLRNITCKKLKTLQLESETNTEILGLMERYSVTGSSVDNIVKTIKSLGETDRTNLIECVQIILKENQHLISGKTKMRDKVSSSYDIHALNASMNPEEIVEMIQNARDFAEKNKTSENGIRMLFYGTSGTGKTEFARYISEKLGKKILLKRASDILDKFVGGTEQNIKAAFEEADRTDSILLLDEADTFFASRDSAQHSWERTQVNELLTQMEEFSGILICTTNLKKIMDSAMNRRFHMIVEFKPLEREGLLCMIERYFSAYDFTEDQLNRLAHCASVTPGDFGVLANRMRFMAPEKLNSEYITQELFKIQDEKDNEAHRQPIGFCA